MAAPGEPDHSARRGGRPGRRLPPARPPALHRPEPAASRASPAAAVLDAVGSPHEEPPGDPDDRAWPACRCPLRRQPDQPGADPAPDGRSPPDVRCAGRGRRGERAPVPGNPGQAARARGRQPPQVTVRRQHEPRAPDAAQRHHRGHGDAPRGRPGGGPAGPDRGPRAHSPRGQAPARPHQRHPRSLEDRGREAGALARVGPARPPGRGRAGHDPAARREEREPGRRGVRATWG
jgi:translation initiation factor IF-2